MTTPRRYMTRAYTRMLAKAGDKRPHDVDDPGETTTWTPSDIGVPSAPKRAKRSPHPDRILSSASSHANHQILNGDADADDNDNDDNSNVPHNNDGDDDKEDDQDDEDEDGDGDGDEEEDDDDLLISQAERWERDPKLEYAHVEMLHRAALMSMDDSRIWWETVNRCYRSGTMTLRVLLRYCFGFPIDPSHVDDSMERCALELMVLESNYSHRHKPDIHIRSWCGRPSDASVDTPALVGVVLGVTLPEFIYVYANAELPLFDVWSSDILSSDCCATEILKLDRRYSMWSTPSSASQPHVLRMIQGLLVQQLEEGHPPSDDFLDALDDRLFAHDATKNPFLFEWEIMERLDPLTILPVKTHRRAALPLMVALCGPSIWSAESQSSMTRWIHRWQSFPCSDPWGYTMVTTLMVEGGLPVLPLIDVIRAYLGLDRWSHRQRAWSTPLEMPNDAVIRHSTNSEAITHDRYFEAALIKNWNRHVTAWNTSLGIAIPPPTSSTAIMTATAVVVASSISSASASSSSASSSSSSSLAPTRTDTRTDPLGLETKRARQFQCATQWSMEYWLYWGDRSDPSRLTAIEALWSDHPWMVVSAQDWYHGIHGSRPKFHPESRYRSQSYPKPPYESRLLMAIAHSPSRSDVLFRPISLWDGREVSCLAMKGPLSWSQLLDLITTHRRWFQLWPLTIWLDTVWKRDRITWSSIEQLATLLELHSTSESQWNSDNYRTWWNHYQSRLDTELSHEMTLAMDFPFRSFPLRTLALQCPARTLLKILNTTLVTVVAPRTMMDPSQDSMVMIPTSDNSPRVVSDEYNQLVRNLRAVLTIDLPHRRYELLSDLEHKARSEDPTPIPESPPKPNLIPGSRVCLPPLDTASIARRTIVLGFEGVLVSMWAENGFCYRRTDCTDPSERHKPTKADVYHAADIFYLPSTVKLTRDIRRPTISPVSNPIQSTLTSASASASVSALASTSSSSATTMAMETEPSISASTPTALPTALPTLAEIAADADHVEGSWTIPSSYSVFPMFVRPGARLFLQRLTAAGYELVLWSRRSRHKTDTALHVIDPEFKLLPLDHRLYFESHDAQHPMSLGRNLDHVLFLESCPNWTSVERNQIPISSFVPPVFRSTPASSSSSSSTTAATVAALSSSSALSDPELERIWTTILEPLTRITGNLRTALVSLGVPASSSSSSSSVVS